MKRTTIGNPLDLRAWLADVRKLGELKDVRGADWNLELGAISELNVKQRHSARAALRRDRRLPERLSRPHLQHEQPRAALVDPAAAVQEDAITRLVQKLRGRPAAWQSEAPKYDPVYAETGPAFENVQRGDEVDLFTFPTPLWHEQDGGRYIGTGCSVVTQGLRQRLGERRHLPRA